MKRRRRETRPERILRQRVFIRHLRRERAYFI